nr:MAG TPA: hypothetical protein [Caudoviricetes sp.]
MCVFKLSYKGMAFRSKTRKKTSFYFIINSYQY